MSNWRNDGSESVVYVCLRCGGSMTAYNLGERGGAVKCIHCGFKVIKKSKPPVVHRIKAV